MRERRLSSGSRGGSPKQSFETAAEKRGLLSTAIGLKADS
jgi:hypothetical protein